LTYTIDILAIPEKPQKITHMLGIGITRNALNLTVVKHQNASEFKWVNRPNEDVVSKDYTIIDLPFAVRQTQLVIVAIRHGRLANMDTFFYASLSTLDVEIVIGRHKLSLFVRFR
jgi:hypothetical protein